MSFLLDTVVLSEVPWRTPSASVVAWFDSTRHEDVYLSVLTLGELRQGVERLRSKQEETRARILEEWLESVMSAYAERIVPVTTEIAQR